MRIISATNRNLTDDVRHGRFREDLFYRLHVFPIAVPPLRERSEDIPDLVRHFLARFAAEEGKRVRAISGEALALLGRHRWPGNVRQLENAVFRAVVLAEGDTIGTSEFPQVAAQVAQAPFAQPSSELPHIASAPAMAEIARRLHGSARPFTARSRCSTDTATCGRSRRSSTRPSASPSRITAGRCRRLRDGCGSGARRSIASSSISASANSRKSRHSLADPKFARLLSGQFCELGVAGR